MSVSTTTLEPPIVTSVAVNVPVTSTPVFDVASLVEPLYLKVTLVAGVNVAAVIVLAEFLI